MVTYKLTALLRFPEAVDSTEVFDDLDAMFAAEDLDAEIISFNTYSEGEDAEDDFEWADDPDPDEVFEWDDDPDPGEDDFEEEE